MGGGNKEWERRERGEIEWGATREGAEKGKEIGEEVIS